MSDQEHKVTGKDLIRLAARSPSMRAAFAGIAHPGLIGSLASYLQTPLQSANYCQVQQADFLLPGCPGTCASPQWSGRHHSHPSGHATGLHIL